MLNLCSSKTLIKIHRSLYFEISRILVYKYTLVYMNMYVCYYGVYSNERFCELCEVLFKVKIVNVLE